ncbi:MAG: DUF2149 domain-containing protein [Methanomethylovorans sp.]|uniref:DUF2149 domain-containing protein n=1 Tax=Methanomethylovorans sp. TaxID=2758717 RepID=UPI000B10D54E|nr:DUF2149 domain-containing protein [Methanomethylovorans sp.]
MKPRRYRRTGLLNAEEERNPLEGVANLFDTAMVFAVALMLALLMSYNLTELLSPTANTTIVKNPGQKDMQIIVKEGQSIEVMNLTDQIGGGTGDVLGTAYKLADGRVVYVPNDGNGDGNKTTT